MLEALKKLFGGGGPAADPRQLIKDGALVIDVRTQSEWSSGHLSMAKHIPVDQLGARLQDVEKWAGGDKSKPIVVYCASGMRSGRARSTLRSAGFTNVVNGGGYGSLC